MKLEEVSPQKIMLVRSEDQLAYGIPSHDWDYLKHLIDNKVGKNRNSFYK
jgi:hypothetical protein